MKDIWKHINPWIVLTNPVNYVKRPFEEFIQQQASGGLVLLVATIFALFMANSPWHDAYHHFWEIEFTFGFSNLALTQSLHHWINDGLMAVFFFVVGLELKREFLSGELADIRKAALPIAAACGGMVVPAALYALVAGSGPAAAGWGIPMATDIAFALGIVAVLGDRIPRSVAVFLTALAIVDDLGAVLVIAIFYTGDINMIPLAYVAGFFVLLWLGNLWDIQSPNFYAIVGFALWVAMLKSGVHASIAGVMIGMTIPTKPRHGHMQFLGLIDGLVERFREIEQEPGHSHDGDFQSEEQLKTLTKMEHVCHDAMSPLQRMEHVMHDWVIFGVMPIFALANAGVSLELGNLTEAILHPVAIGVTFGLFIGKPLGILLFSWLAVKMKLCKLPTGAGWREVLGVGILAGIGFTMSMFISNLAFADALLQMEAKIGIFAASILSGVIGYWFLSKGKKRQTFICIE